MVKTIHLYSGHYDIYRFFELPGTKIVTFLKCLKYVNVSDINNRPDLKDLATELEKLNRD